MKGIIYVRVSSLDQVHGTSLENQQAACVAYAANKNIKVEKIFIERGESATAANRTQFVQALDYCKRHKDIGAFIVWKIDRFARNTSDHFHVRGLLVQYGTTLHSVTEPITNDPQGKLMETLLAGFAEFENDSRKQRCIAGMQGAMRHGLYVGPPKFGYKRPKKSSRRITEPDIQDQNSAPLFKRGLQLYAKGNISISELARQARGWGLRSRTGITLSEKRWTELLDDKYYAGIITDPWTGEEYQGQHEPLITLEEFATIQQVKRHYGKNKQARVIEHPEFPLRRFAKCSCGHALTASKSKGRKEYYSYYHCKKRGCEYYGRAIRKDELEQAFIAFLESITPKEEYLKLFEATVLREWETQKAAVSNQRTYYSQQLAALEIRKARLIEMREEGDIDKDEFKRRKADIDNRIAGLTISENESEIDKLDLETRIMYALNNMRNIARIWQDLEVGNQIRLQKAVLPNGIEYDKTNGRFGTADLSYVFSFFLDFPKDESALVAGPGIEPGSGGSVLRTVSNTHGLSHIPQLNCRNSSL